jgi:hypothetical protein
VLAISFCSLFRLSLSRHDLDPGLGKYNEALFSGYLHVDLLVLSGILSLFSRSAVSLETKNRDIYIQYNGMAIYGIGFLLLRKWSV